MEWVELKTPMEYVQPAQVDMFLTVIETNVWHVMLMKLPKQTIASLAHLDKYK